MSNRPALNRSAESDQTFLQGSVRECSASSEAGPNHSWRSMTFVDEAQINVAGGSGGAGCVSFLHEYRRPYGGPDGGDGGDGGDLIIVADASVATLVRFLSEIHFKAESGVHGSGKKRHGKRGADRSVFVPPGTVIRSLDDEFLADLVAVGDAYNVVHGGRGGRGNARFASNRRRVPKFAEQGEPGEERWIRLEIRLVADVAIVGFPNVGKSTLISAVSAARPKVADYPFTTLTPNLGVVTVDDDVLVLADIPGLIEGAADGRGLGHQFLRHVERASVLLLLLDPFEPEHSAVRQALVLIDELGNYQPELLDRPRIVALTKGDAVDDADAEQMIGELDSAGLGGDTGARIISSVSRSGLHDLVRTLAPAVERARASTPKRSGFVVHRPAPPGTRVVRDGGGDGWIVEGADARRAVALSDMTDSGAIEYLDSALRKLGVNKALDDAGCRAGDLVRIAEFEFEYEPDEPVGIAGVDEKHRRAGGGRRRGARRT